MIDAAEDERWRRADELFARLLDLPPDARARHLEDAAGDDDDLRGIVEKLLAAEARDDALLDGRPLVDRTTWLQPPPSGEVPAPAPAANLVGQRLGPFEAVAELGHGGMAVVYLGRRVDGDFEQEVAIKVLDRVAATRDVLHRFRRERQILAASAHPGMARILDGGETADGRPYLVMERVDGERIDAWCDARRLSVRARVRLFLDVARTVEDAHRRLVVHRDVKPSNILVTRDGHTKLLDFGIAKLLEGADGGDPTLTRSRLMTPAYAAPEQVLGQAVTTATDVYQLGLLLYELVSGTLPYSTAGGPAEVAQRICHEPPTRPAAAVARTGETVARDAEAVAQRRHTSLRHLRRELRGDLEPILLTALRKEPAQRYRSVGALVADLERWLDGQPVEARGGAPLYRAARFVGRHRGGVAVASTVAVLLVGWSVSSSWQARRLTAERDRANREAATARQVASFLTDLFVATDPIVARSGDLTAHELLDRGARRLADGDIADPLVAARLRATIGGVYYHLSNYDPAVELLREAVDGLAAELGPSAEETLEARSELLAALHLSGDVDGAGRLARELHGLLAWTHGEDHPRTLAVLDRRGEIAYTQGRLGEAEAFHRRALEAHRRRDGDGSREVLGSQTRLSRVLTDAGRLRESEALLRATVDGLRRELGDDHPAVLTNANRLVVFARRRGRLADAVAGHEALLPRFAEVIGADHPVTHAARLSLAAAELARGGAERARELAEGAVAALREALGDEHPMTVEARIDLARALLALGHSAEATAHVDAAADAARRTLGPRSPYTVAADGERARALRSTGRAAAATELYAELVERAASAFGPGHVQTAQLLFDAACHAVEDGRPADARTLLARAAEATTVLDLADPVLPRLRADPALRPLLARIEARRAAEGIGR